MVSQGTGRSREKAGGRGYFYDPIPAPAKTYRATVQSFDKVAVVARQVQAP